MKIVFNIVVLLVLGFIQMAVMQIFHLHGNLSHMQYEHWGWYVIESLFYTLYWFVVLNVVIKPSKK